MTSPIFSVPLTSAGLERKSRLLFHYRAVDASVEAVTAQLPRYLRTGTATTVGTAAGLLYAPPSLPRFGYADFSTGDGGKFGVYLEGARTNRIIRAMEVGGTGWTATGTPTRVAGAKLCGHFLLDLLGDDTGASAEYWYRAITFSGNAAKAVSFVVAPDPASPSTQPVVRIRDTSASANRLVVTCDLSGATPVFTASTGTLLGWMPLGNGCYWVCARTTTVTASNSNRMEVYPAGTTSGNQGTVYLGLVQAEDALSPSTFIPTFASVVARDNDDLRFVAAFAPRTMRIRTEFIELGAVGVSDAAIWSLTNETETTGARLFVASTGTGYRITYNNDVTEVTSDVTADPPYGSRVVLDATISETGNVQLHQSINGAAFTSGSLSSGLALPASWGDGTAYLRLGSRGGGANPGSMLLLSHKVAPGSMTRDEVAAAL